MLPDAKPRWGRDAAAVGEVTSGRLSAGTRSVLLGLGASLLLSIALVVFTGRAGETSGGWATVRLLAALAAYFLAAPVVLVMGLAAGFRGLFGMGGGRTAAVLGLFLNVAVLALGITVVVVALASPGRAS